MTRRIIRGVRVATTRGIEPASVFVEDGQIVYVAGYEDIARDAQVEELGKSLLMPGLIASSERPGPEQHEQALLGGITSLVADDAPVVRDSELSQYLSKTWTAMRERDQSLELLVQNLCTAPAKRAGLGDRKGRIDIGLDADFVIWNPEYTVTGAQPPLYGLVRQVIVAGHTRVREGLRL